MPSTLDELLKIARHAVNKRAFVDAAAAGGQPPMDPAAMGGGGGMPMDPAAMGGAPPPTDPAAGGGGGDPALTAKIDQLITMMSQGGGAGAGGAAGGLKPKIDVNVEIMQIKNILAKIADTLGVQIPAQDMVATPEKLTAMAQGQSTQTPMGGAGGAGGSAIAPIDPMQGASPALAGAGGGGGGGMGGGGGEKGAAANMLMDIGVKAAALSLILEKRSAKR
jgi:hypothetical protein